MRILVSAGICFLAVVAYSCRGNAASDENEKVEPVSKSNPPPVKLIEIDTPKENQRFASGDVIDLEISLLGERVPDSVRVYFDGNYLFTLYRRSL